MRRANHGEVALMINGAIRINGQLEIIHGAEDLVQVIRERLGDDAAKMVQTLADLSDKAAHLADSDFRANEMALDGAHATMREIGEQIELIRKEINEARIKRVIVHELLDDIERWVGEHT